ncbi:hypothetical protein BGX23_003307, partial [Mortierella sp. AD031]
MDPLSQLPLECLYRILETLAQDNNSAALAALLRTSRYFSTVTLPFLYKEPFKFAPFVSHHNEKEDIPIVSRIPTRALFASIPHSNLSKVLILGLELPVTDSALDAEPTTTIASVAAVTPSSLLSLNYFAQIRHLHLQPWAVGVDHLWKWSHAPPSVLAYIQTEEFVQKCKLSNLTPIPNWLGIPKLDSEFYQRCYQVLFFREASWALASPILEQLQSLSIPFSQIEWYVAEMRRLRSLERVIFVMDEIQMTWKPFAMAFLMVEPKKVETEGSRRENAVRFRSVIQFVEEHTRLFKGLLKSVKMIGSGLWTWISSFPEVYPDSVQMEINRLLPVLWRPISLGHDELLRFLANPKAMMDLSQVVEIDAWSLNGARRGVFRDNQQALQRCRVLKRLKIELLGEGSFKWAVDEKRMLEQYGPTRPIRRSDYSNGQVILSIGMDGDEGSSSRLEYWRAGLVPLEEVDIVSYNESLIKETVDDIAFAFSRTLRRLSAVCYESSSSTDRNRIMHVVDVGKDWVDLPFLTHLSLYTRQRRLVIDRNLLVCCPNVVSVDLSDDTLEYRCEEIVPCLPIHLSELETLSLSGWPALTFHPSTLDSTTRLKELSIICSTYTEKITFETLDMYDCVCEDFWDPDCFIPFPDELNLSYGTQNDSTLVNNSSTPERVIRPYWSWDWDLPCLSSLTLSSEFAFRFEFHMLQGCPALQFLELNTRARANRHSRTLSMQDLYAQSSMVSAPRTYAATVAHPGDNDLSNLQSLSALGLNLISMSDVFRTVTARPERTTIKELFMNLDWDLGDDGEKEFRLYYDNGKDFDFDRKGVVME